MKHYIIYQTTNMINGMRYIGKHTTDDLNDGYLGSGVRLNNAIGKYGKVNFNREILYYCDSLDHLNELESLIVNEELVSNPSYYNMMVGGHGGPQLDKVVRGKLSIESKRQWSGLTKAERKEKAKPLWSSRTTEDRRSSVIGKKNPMYGLTAKDIPGWSENLSAANARKDHRLHKFEHATGLTYIGTVSDFYKSHSFDRSHVSRVMRGIKHSIHGWKYHGTQE